VRLLTLTGPGGIGKTRLALQVAAELGEAFAHGVWWVPLAAIGDPELLVTTIARALGIQELSSRSDLDGVRAFLQDKELLLLLDNFEQIIAASPLLSDLLQASSRLKVLVTSRTVLNLAAEYEFPLAPLALPPPDARAEAALLQQYASVELFVERARKVRPDLQLSDAGATVVAEICRQLDGLPLAIELTAARSKLFAPEALLARLTAQQPGGMTGRLALLTGGPRDVPARQQTLRATIDWSYRLLSSEHQQLFTRLGVFAGGWTLEAADAVCNANGDLPGAALDELQVLVDHSLVQQEPGPAGEPRFSFLETLREYAVEQLAALEGRAALRRQHAIYCVALAEAAEPELEGFLQHTRVRQLTVEQANCREALAWLLRSPADADADVVLGMRLSGALWRFWQMHGELSEGRRWLTLALECARSVGVDKDHAPLQAKLLLGAAWLAWHQGDFPAGRVSIDGCVALWRGPAASLPDEQTAQRGYARALASLARALQLDGDYTTAEACARESRALALAVGDRWGRALALESLAEGARLTGDDRAARTFGEESLALLQELGDDWAVAKLWRVLGTVALWQGEYATARAHLEASLARCQELGDTLGRANLLDVLGELARAEGEYARARMILEESLVLQREIGDEVGLAISQRSLGLLALDEGDVATGRMLLQASLRSIWTLGHKTEVMICLEALAREAGMGAGIGQTARAARLSGAVAALREAYGLPRRLPATWEKEAAGASDGDVATGESGWAEGEAMTLEQAVAYALAETNPE
jgi:predicted ATPase